MARRIITPLPLMADTAFAATLMLLWRR